MDEAYGVPEFGAHPEKSAICRQNANPGTPRSANCRWVHLRLNAPAPDDKSTARPSILQSLLAPDLWIHSCAVEPHDGDLGEACLRPTRFSLEVQHFGSHYLVCATFGSAHPRYGVLTSTQFAELAARLAGALLCILHKTTAMISLMNKRDALTGCRVLFGLLGFSAVVTEIATLVERGGFSLTNFLSYFTVESNSLAAAILILSALALAGGKQGRLIAMLRGASTLNMILVGVLFTLLLSGIEDAEFTAVPWDNIVLHYMMPIVVAVDWFIDIPEVRIPFKQALVWLLFPMAYLIYNLIRGHVVSWYPYSFLDPSNHGYISVATLSVALALAAAGLAWVLARFTVRGAATNVV